MPYKIREAVNRLVRYKLEQSSRPILSNNPLSEREFREIAAVLQSALEEIDERLSRLEKERRQNR